MVDPTGNESKIIQVIKEPDEDGDSEEELEFQASGTAEAGTKVEEAGTKPRGKRYITKHMKLYPELYRSDVSIHPSYTGLKSFPYYILCRRRLKKMRKLINQQLNREIMHFAMMQMLAIDGVKIDRVFSIGMSPKNLIVPDFATEKERRRLNELLRDR